MAVNRRRQRSTRILLAMAVLAVGGLIVVTSLFAGSLWFLGAAAIAGYVAGVSGARIISNELAQTRRDGARDRAALAGEYQQLAATRAAEHANFAQSMTERMIDRDTTIRDLRSGLRLAERRGADATVRLRRESKRTAELQTRLAELYAELDRRSEAIADAVRQAALADEALAVWDGADPPTLVELMAWEAGVTAAGEARRDESDTA